MKKYILLFIVIVLFLIFKFNYEIKDFIVYYGNNLKESFVHRAIPREKLQHGVVEFTLDITKYCPENSKKPTQYLALSVTYFEVSYGDYFTDKVKCEGNNIQAFKHVYDKKGSYNIYLKKISSSDVGIPYVHNSILLKKVKVTEDNPITPTVVLSKDVPEVVRIGERFSIGVHASGLPLEYSLHAFLVDAISGEKIGSMRYASGMYLEGDRTASTTLDFIFNIKGDYTCKPPFICESAHLVGKTAYIELLGYARKDLSTFTETEVGPTLKTRVFKIHD